VSFGPIIPATPPKRGLSDQAARAGRFKGAARHKRGFLSAWYMPDNTAYPLCLIFIFIMLLFMTFWIPPTALAGRVAVFWQVLGKCWASARQVLRKC